MDNSRNDSSSQTISGESGTYIPTLYLLLTALWLYNTFMICFLTSIMSLKLKVLRKPVPKIPVNIYNPCLPSISIIV